MSTKKLLKILNFLLTENSKPDNSNFNWRRSVFFHYGKTLLALGKLEEATTAFESSLNLQEGNDSIPDYDKLYFRAVSLHKAGKRGYRKNFVEAANQGSKAATKYPE